MSLPAVVIVSVRPDEAGRTLQVHLSDGTELEVARDAPEVRALSPGTALDAQALAGLHEAAARKQAARLALRLLARRRLSRMRLRQRLLDAALAPAAVEAVLAQLTDQGLLDDRDLARAFATDQLARRPVGRAWLLARLRRLGVARADAEAGIALISPVTGELARACAALQARSARPGGAETAPAALRFLMSRGFAPAVARRAILDVLGRPPGARRGRAHESEG